MKVLGPSPIDVASSIIVFSDKTCTGMICKHMLDGIFAHSDQQHPSTSMLFSEAGLSLKPNLGVVDREWALCMRHQISLPHTTMSHR